MPIVYIPAPLRKLAEGRQQMEVEGATVADAVEALERQCPGIAQRLLPQGQLPAGMQLVVDNKVARLTSTPVGPETEIHFLPAVGGG